MATLQLSGLASGFDWKSVVDQLMTLNRVPQDRLRSEKSTNTSKISTFSTLRTRLTALQTSAKALTSDSLFAQRSASLANPDLNWTASAANGTATGSYTFNVTQLATKSVRTGSSGVGSSVSATNDVSGILIPDVRVAVPISEGVFTVNGEQVEVGETDTLQDVFDKIATATGGAVTASYDSGTDTVTLASSGTIELGGGADTSNFLFALKLYNNDSNSITSTSALGVSALNETIASAGLSTAITAVDGDGNGSFEINGVSISYNVNTDTISGLMSRISNSEAGAVLTHDSSQDRFILTNKNTGDHAVTVSESAGGLLNALGLTSGASVVRGQNAEFSLNGGSTIISASNVLDTSVHGITGLTVTATSQDAQTVEVAADTEAVEKGIRSFISAYNEVQKFVDEQTKVTVGTNNSVTAGLFANNRELTNIARSLRGFVFDEVSGVSGAIKRLESIGIDFAETSSQLTVRDEAAFSEALAGNLGAVTDLFTTSTTGITARVDGYLTSITNTNGLIDTQENSLERQNVLLDQQIADLERRLESERSRLEESFIRMEEAQSLISSQLATLQRTLNL